MLFQSFSYFKVYINMPFLFFILIVLILCGRLNGEILLEHSPLSVTKRDSSVFPNENVIKEDIAKAEFEIKELPEELFKDFEIQTEPKSSKSHSFIPLYIQTQTIYMEGKGVYENGDQFNFFLVFWIGQETLDLISYGMLDHSANSYIKWTRSKQYLSEDGTAVSIPAFVKEETLEEIVEVDTSFSGIVLTKEGTEYEASIEPIVLNEKKVDIEESHVSWTFNLFLTSYLDEYIYYGRGSHLKRKYMGMIDEKINIKIPFLSKNSSE